MDDGDYSRNCKRGTEYSTLSLGPSTPLRVCGSVTLACVNGMRSASYVLPWHQGGEQCVAPAKSMRQMRRDEERQKEESRRKVVRRRDERTWDAILMFATK